MNLLFYLTIIKILSITLCTDSEFFIDKDNLMLLNDSSFDLALKKYDTMMVLFTETWCIRCQNFFPEFKLVMEKLKDSNITFAKCYITGLQNISARYNIIIRELPIVKLFIKGEVFNYKGKYEEKNIIKFIKKKTEPNLIELNSEEEVIKFLNENDISLIYFGDNKEQIEIFKNVSNENEEILFRLVSNKEIINKYKAKQNSIVLFKNFEEKRNDLTENLSKKNIEDFISKHSKHKLNEFTQENSQLIFEKKTNTLFLFVKSHSKEEENLKKILINVKNIYEGDILIIVSDFVGTLPEYLGVKNEDLPAIILVDFKKKVLNKYKFSEEINEKNLLKFLENFEKNKLKLYLKSEEEPKTNDKVVYKLVGKTFNKVVLDSDKDVLVNFYIPRCWQCKVLKIFFDKIADNLKNNKNLILAEIDHSLNDVENINLKNYPTLILWPAKNKKKHKIFKGNNSIDDIVKFLIDNASYKNEIIKEINNIKKKENETKIKDKKEKKNTDL